MGFPLRFPFRLAGRARSFPLPYDTSPLRAAIIHALTHWTGQPRAVPQDYLFELGRPIDVKNGAKSGDVYRQTRFLLLPITDRPIDRFQLCDRARIEATVEIRFWYFGGDVHRTEYERMNRLAARDKRLIGEALCYPGALYSAPDGTPTGLDGGSLRMDGDRWEVRGPTLLRNSGVYQVTHFFRATLELRIREAS